MLKKLSVLLLVLVVLIGAAALYLITNANALVSRYKPELEMAATKALGAPVSLGSLSVSLFPAATIAVSDAVLGAAPDGTGGFRLGQFDLAMRLGALFRGALEITAITLRSPKITLIKQGGVTTIEGLPATASAAPATAAQARPQAKDPSGAAVAPLSVSLERFSLDGGEVVFKDLDKKITRSVSRVSVQSAVRIGSEAVELPSLSLSGVTGAGVPFAAEVSALTFGLRSSELNAEKILTTLFKNTVELSTSIKTSVPSGTFALRSPGIDLASLRPLLKEFSPGLEALNLLGSVSPSIRGRFDLQGNAPAYEIAGSVGVKSIGLDSGPIALRELTGAVDLSSSQGRLGMRSQKLALSVNGEPLEVALQGGFAPQSGQLSVDPVTIAGFGGTTKASAQIAPGKPGSLGVRLDAQNIKVANLMRIAPQGNPLGLSGTIASARASLQGALGDIMINSLKGSIGFVLKDGSLNAANIVGSVIKQLATLPIGPSATLEGLDPKTKAALEGNSTAITSLSADFAVANGAMTTSNLALESPLFSLTGSGVVGFNGSVDFATTISLTPELSASVVRSAKGLARALDANKRLVLPLRIAGTAPAIKVLPNTEKLLGMAAEKAIESGLKKLLKEQGDGKKKGLGGLLGNF